MKMSYSKPGCSDGITKVNRFVLLPTRINSSFYLLFRESNPLQQGKPPRIRMKASQEWINFHGANSCVGGANCLVQPMKCGVHLPAISVRFCDLVRKDV